MTAHTLREIPATEVHTTLRVQARVVIAQPAKTKGDDNRFLVQLLTSPESLRQRSAVLHNTGISTEGHTLTTAGSTAVLSNRIYSTDDRERSKVPTLNLTCQLELPDTWTELTGRDGSKEMETPPSDGR